MRSNLFLLLSLFLFFSPASAWSASQLEVLEERIRALESDKKDSSSQKTNTTTSSKPSNKQWSWDKSSIEEWGTATGISRRFNPAISVNGLFLGTYNSAGNYDTTKTDRTGLKIQEAEVQFTSSIDNWLTGNIVLSIEGTAGIEIEEIITEALITRNLNLRAGKFFVPFGKHNQLHTHAYAFIDRPVVNQEIFGEEGLNEQGIGFSYLMPADWFSQLSFQILEGNNLLQFNGPAGSDFAYLIRENNFWDLDDETTLELGGTYVYGKNSLAGPSDFDNETHLAGMDLTLKWQPAGRENYKTFIWQTEIMGSFREQTQEGWYTQVQHQFAKEWWIQGRYSGYKIPNGPNQQDKNQWSALLAWESSEFSAIRLQYNHLNQVTEDEDQVLLQLNFTLGSHPAHNY
jgi:hypothetical protein